MIVEFFGLSKSGKSTLKKRLGEEGHKVMKFEEILRFKKAIYFLRYLYTHALCVVYLFWKMNSNYLIVKGVNKKDYIKVFLMRNSYLIGVLSKYEMIRNKKERIFTDEFSFQSVFMILQKKSDVKEIKEVLRHLPRSEMLFLFDRTKKERHEAYEIPHKRIEGATLMPGSWIDFSYAENWMDTMEFNFELMKEVVKEMYVEDKSLKKDLKLGKEVKVFRLKESV